jgi:uncharacterized protein (TIGR02246 family)
VIPVRNFDREGVEAFGKAWSRAFEMGDFNVIAAVYDDDATLVAGHGYPIVGRPAIVDFWREACRRASRRRIRRTVHIDQYDYCGDAAYLQGTVSLRSETGGTTVVWFATIWKRQRDDTWRIVTEISSVAARALDTSALAGRVGDRRPAAT